MERRTERCPKMKRKVELMQLLEKLYTKAREVTKTEGFVPAEVAYTIWDSLVELDDDVELKLSDEERNMMTLVISLAAALENACQLMGAGYEKYAVSVMASSYQLTDALSDFYDLLQ